MDLKTILFVGFIPFVVKAQGPRLEIDDQQTVPGLPPRKPWTSKPIGWQQQANANPSQSWSRPPIPGAGVQVPPPPIDLAPILPGSPMAFPPNPMNNANNEGIPMIGANLQNNDSELERQRRQITGGMGFARNRGMSMGGPWGGAGNWANRQFFHNHPGNRAHHDQHEEQRKKAMAQMAKPDGPCQFTFQCKSKYYCINGQCLAIGNEHRSQYCNLQSNMFCNDNESCVYYSCLTDHTKNP